MQRAWTNPLLNVVVVLFSVAALPTEAEGSILLPMQPALDILEVVDESDESSSAPTSGTHVPTSGTPVAPNHTPIGHSDLYESPTPSPASSSGASTGGVSSGATGLASTAVMTCDSDLVAWLLFDFSLSVPDPPGSDLLRPPQTPLNI